MRELFESIGSFAVRHWTERAKRDLPVDSVTMTERYVMALHREVDELLDEVPWKDHRKIGDERTVIVDNVLEEIADIIFYCFSLAQKWGATYPQLEEAMQTKRAVIENRWREEHAESFLTRPIALIDLDGVLCQWPEPFISRYLDLDIPCGDPLAHSILNVGATTVLDHYQRFHKAHTIASKHAYRLEGEKRHLPAIWENVQATTALAELYDIVIMSKRPVHRYSRIEGDTLFWLNHFSVPFKRLIFTEDKPLRVVLDGWANQVALAVDDDPDNVDKLRDLGIKVYQIGQDINTMADLEEVRRILHA